METGICIYCGRTLALSELLAREGKYRCKNDADCLEFQIQTHSPDPPEEPEALAALVKAALDGAAGRMAAYGTEAEPVGAAEGAPAAEGWMAAAIALLAAEFRDKTGFRFEADEKEGHTLVFAAADGQGGFRATVAPLAPSGWALIVARTDAAGEREALYREFIYKSYPETRREELLADLAVALLALAGEEGRRLAVLGHLRREIEARSR